jgi:hypothetical protein
MDLEFILEIFCLQKFVPLVGFFFFDRTFLPHKNKCKVLELIPHNLEGNQCEMMALVCLRMLMSVNIMNMRTQPLEPMLMLTQGAHTFDVKEEEEQEVFVPTEEGGANLS